MASNEPLLIFVSYARSDDQPPVEGEGRGFVTTLVKYVEHRLVELGRPPVAEVWRDNRAIVPSDQFGPVIEAGIAVADVLLVVLSNNWLNSKWCLKEAELFAGRFATLADAKRRIVVVNKRYVQPEARPEALQGQEGYKFFRRDKDSPGGFYEYFALGKTCLPEFQTVVESLSYDLWGRACTKDDMKVPIVVDVPEPPKAERKIFVGRPAPDMKAAFERIVQELQNRGYEVAPKPSLEIPLDETAAAFFERSLAGAEAAIHLLGDKLGFSPDDNLLPIAKLQLQLTDKHAAEHPRFRRLIWAPSELPNLPARDALDVLRRFGEKIDTDKVDGNDLSAFVDFIVKHLHDNAPGGVERRTLPADARVYVYHQREDTEYAKLVAKALRDRNVGTVFPIFQGDAAKLRDWHESQLKHCDAVLVCWANADEAFTFSMIDECSDWRTLGRQNEFSSRVVVVGPPRDERKEVLIEFPPRPEVDVVIDLTGVERPGPDEFGPFLSATVV